MQMFLKIKFSTSDRRFGHQIGSDAKRKIGVVWEICQKKTLISKNCFRVNNNFICKRNKTYEKHKKGELYIHNACTICYDLLYIILCNKLIITYEN